MIFQLSGQLVVKQGFLVVVNVHGVGYGVYVPASTLLNLPNLGEQIFLHTHMVVREDAQNLYGFSTEQERLLFIEFIKISGVGPKVALSILSHLSVDQFLHIIRLQQEKELLKIPGLGKKMAQRLMIEMHSNISSKKFIENFAADGKQHLTTKTDITNCITNEVQEALVSLGYKPQQAFLAVSSAEKSCRDAAVPVKTISSETLLKSSLKFLSKAYHD